MMAANLTTELVHRQELREQAEIRTEILAGTQPARCRLGLYRGSPASEASEFVLVSGFAVDLAGARELRSAIALAIYRLEALDTTADADLVGDDLPY